MFLNFSKSYQNDSSSRTVYSTLEMSFFFRTARSITGSAKIQGEPRRFGRRSFVGWGPTPSSDEVRLLRRMRSDEGCSLETSNDVLLAFFRYSCIPISIRSFHTHNGKVKNENSLLDSLVRFSFFTISPFPSLVIAFKDTSYCE
jgi:hypothetical protein